MDNSFFAGGGRVGTSVSDCVFLVLCRCRARPTAALAAAATLFQRTPLCDAPTDRSLLLSGPHYSAANAAVNTSSVTHLLARPRDKPVAETALHGEQERAAASGHATHAQRGVDGAASGHEHEQRVSTGGRTLTGQPEPDAAGANEVWNRSSVAAASKTFLRRPRDNNQQAQTNLLRAQRVHNAEVRNLKRTRWLGAFTEPLFHTCPLVARKVPRESVSEFAAAAWRCDGLGFAWECLVRAQQQTASAGAAREQ